MTMNKVDPVVGSRSIILDALSLSVEIIFVSLNPWTKSLKNKADEAVVVGLAVFLAMDAVSLDYRVCGFDEKPEKRVIYIGEVRVIEEFGCHKIFTIKKSKWEWWMT